MLGVPAHANLAFHIRPGSAPGPKYRPARIPPFAGTNSDGRRGHRTASRGEGPVTPPAASTRPAPTTAGASGPAETAAQKAWLMARPAKRPPGPLRHILMPPRYQQDVRGLISRPRHPQYRRRLFVVSQKGSHPGAGRILVYGIQRVDKGLLAPPKRKDPQPPGKGGGHAWDVRPCDLQP